MTTKTMTRCYRFQHVDFEPDLCLLVWPDQTETQLTVHETQLLEVLCYFAGEVINLQALYDKAFLQTGSNSDLNQPPFDLNTILVSLSRKLERNNSMAIPIQVIPNYGFRVPLPDKTCRLVHTVKESTQSESNAPSAEPELSATEDIVKNSLFHKISVLLLALTGVALFLLSEYF
ncbi:hypothetical protein [Photobacterium sp.]|uniref:hypothetical protein n=1 Tax=Photobacterium sp. TaxID=660 RepID=UPI00299D365C|nr:hypothetical protein [Photobacterium sp.]MDX1304538.1 hypothetical protein [Photobacterium sp.]